MNRMSCGISWAGKSRHRGLQLPFCALMLLKPCKVKRFLAAAALSEVGLVSSDPRWDSGGENGVDIKEGKDKMSEDRQRKTRCRHHDTVTGDSHLTASWSPVSLTFPCWFRRRGGVDVALGLLLLSFLEALLTGSERTANGQKNKTKHVSAKVPARGSAVTDANGPT